MLKPWHLQCRRHEVENEDFNRNEQVVGLQDLSEHAARESKECSTHLANGQKGLELVNGQLHHTNPNRPKSCAIVSARDGKATILFQQEWCSAALKNDEPRSSRAGAPAIPSVRGDARLHCRRTSNDTPVACHAGTPHWIYFARHAQSGRAFVLSRRHPTSPPHHDYPLQGFPAPRGRNRWTGQPAGPLDTSNAAACSRKLMVEDATGGGCVTHHHC